MSQRGAPPPVGCHPISQKLKNMFFEAKQISFVSRINRLILDKTHTLLGPAVLTLHTFWTDYLTKAKDCFLGGTHMPLERTVPWVSVRMWWLGLSLFTQASLGLKRHQMTKRNPSFKLPDRHHSQGDLNLQAVCALQDSPLEAMLLGYSGFQLVLHHPKRKTALIIMCMLVRIVVGCFEHTIFS